MSTIQRALEGYLGELLSEEGQTEPVSSPKNEPPYHKQKVPNITEQAPQSSLVKAGASGLALATNREKHPTSEQASTGQVSTSVRPIASSPSDNNAMNDDASCRDQVNSRNNKALVVQSEPRSADSTTFASPEELERDKKAELQKLLAKSTMPVEPTIETSTTEEVGPVIGDIKPQTRIDDPVPEITAEATAVDDGKNIPPNIDVGRPAWAETEFEVLLFDVAGLSLAVPLVTLGQIFPFSDKLTVLQGQSEWFMGILPTAIGDIRTVNTALFVMPDRYKDTFLTEVKYVVTINDLPWGLAVDAVKQPVTLRPEDVKWRSRSSSKRPWLAGTVKSHMCTLIDVPSMATMLENSDKNRA